MKEQQHKQKTWLLMENPNSLLHLTAAFDHHRGLCRGATGAAPIFEVHLKEHFLGGMNPDIAASVRISCISWKTISIDHNLHLACRTWRRPNCCARQKQKGKCQNKLYDTQFSMYQALTECRHCKRCSRCRGAPVGLKQPLDPNVCHNFGLTGHWHRDYPKKNREECISQFRLRVRCSRTDPSDGPASTTHTQHNTGHNIKLITVK